MHTALLLLALLADPANVGTVKGEVRMEDSALPGVVIDDVFPTCNLPCSDDQPTSPTDPPSCSDYNLDTSLIDSASHGDRSAISLLKTRYDTMTSLSERHRIGAALLTRVHDDDRYWKELLRDAENAVRFPLVDGKTDETLVAWCAERGWDASEYSGVAYDALSLIGSDPRSHDLLLRALKSDDNGIVFSAIWGLGEQHDEASLPEIEHVIERFPKTQTSLATSLVSFKSEAADRIAFRYLEGDDRDAYMEARNATPEK